MVNATDLLTKIRNDVEAKRFKPIVLAREAGLAPSTLYTMLEPGWAKKTIEHLDALAQAYAEIAKDIPGAGTKPADATA